MDDQPTPDGPTIPDPVPLVETQDDPAGPAATPTARKPGARVRLWIFGLLVVTILALAAGMGAWGLSLNSELEQTTTTVAARAASIGDTESTTAKTLASLSAEQEATARAEAEIARLTDLSTKKSACIADQAKVLAELDAIFETQKKNFARTTTGSKFAKADAASWKAMQTSVDDMQKAYKAIVGGSVSSANTWVTRSNAQVQTENRQVKIANTEIKAINKTTDGINASLDALDTKLGTTASLCGV